MENAGNSNRTSTILSKRCRSARVLFERVSNRARKCHLSQLESSSIGMCLDKPQLIRCITLTEIEINGFMHVTVYQDKGLQCHSGTRMFPGYLDDSLCATARGRDANLVAHVSIGAKNNCESRSPPPSRSDRIGS